MQRKDFVKKQEERRKEEENERYQNLPKGFKALWSRMSGKYGKIKSQNEREEERCKIRDREEKQALIDHQLMDRQNLQDQVLPIHRKHQNLIVQLKKDVAKYMKMGELDKKTLQEKLNQMAKEETRQNGRGQNRGYIQEM